MKIRLTFMAVLLTVIMGGLPCPAQEIESDTLRPVPDSASYKQENPEDTTAIEIVPHIRAFDFDSSLSALLLNPRWDLGSELARSYFHDAGDILKFNPSNQVIFYQNSPVRTTVAPFALPGNRMNAIFDFYQLNPLGHVLEPDGRLDFNDIPTAQVQKLYNVEGPLGLALGGSNATSSLVMFPYEPDSNRIESRLVVDKGIYGYAYTKAVLANRDENGRVMRVAFGYRKANGLFTHRNDDAYHQYYELDQPLFTRLELKASVRLYHRQGAFSPRPDSSNFFLNRERLDRDINAGLYYNHDENAQSSVSFRHQRSESRLSLISELYERNIDAFNNGVTSEHYQKVGRFSARARGEIGQERFYERDNGNYAERMNGYGDLLLLTGDSSKSLTFYGRGEVTKNFGPSPTGEITLVINSRTSSFSASAGYTTKFPRLYDLNLSVRTDPIYSNTGSDYFESGNPDIVAEKQMIGNVNIAVGQAGSDLSLAVTGGKIKDAIDWIKFDTVGYASGGYRPANHNIDFVSTTLKQRITLGENFYWSGGGSYHYVKYSDNANPPYTPEYQTFTNLEVYYYVFPLDLHLYAYGELLYTGPYTGINGQKFGKAPVFNVKLSFRIKKFRFYYLFQNMLNREYEAREDYPLVGRNNYYGITWEFLD